MACCLKNALTGGAACTQQPTLTLDAARTRNQDVYFTGTLRNATAVQVGFAYSATNPFPTVDDNDVPGSFVGTGPTGTFLATEFVDPLGDYYGRAYSVETAGADPVYSANVVVFTISICLPAGTLVATADGGQCPVEHLRPDTLLLTWDAARGALTAAPPLWLAAPATHAAADLWCATWHDGSTLQVVGGHRVFDLARQRYVPLAEGVCGVTRVAHLSGRELVLKALTHTVGPVTCYNVLAAGGHLAVFANGVRTSCRYSNPLEETQPCGGPSGPVDPRLATGLNLPQEAWAAHAPYLARLARHAARAVLLLDHQGVLATSQGPWPAPRVPPLEVPHVAVVNALVAAMPCLDIVVCSDWAKDHTLAQLKAMYAAAGATPATLAALVDTTAAAAAGLVGVHCGSPAQRRAAEVAAYVAAATPALRWWAVVDDLDVGPWLPQCARAVRTDPKAGLAAPGVAAAVKQALLWTTPDP
jgi:hypothetical protein